MKLVLKSTTFLWMGDGKGFLYNTENYSHLSFDIDNDDIASCCRIWQNIDNLYVAHFDEKESHPDFLLLASKIKSLGLGEIVEDNTSAMALPPVLKIKHAVENLHLWEGGMRAQPVLSYLMCLRVFLGGNADCQDWWRQVLYPMSAEQRLDVPRFFSFLRKCDFRTLSNIELIVSEWDQIRIRELIGFLSGTQLKGRVSVVFTHPDPGYTNDIIGELSADRVNLLQVCPPGGEMSVSSWAPGRKYNLLIRSEDDYRHWSSIVANLPDKDYNLIPVAEDNVDFFRANVFLSEEEILSQKLSKKDIFRHQALNVNQFGVLYVFPDGSVHSAPYAPAIGTLEDSVHQVIIRELEENHAWRQTRREMEPCRNCIYHDMCPSPTAYERVLGVPACTVKP